MSSGRARSLSCRAPRGAWQHHTNTNQRQVNWHFTTDDAEVKLRHLYPRPERVGVVHRSLATAMSQTARQGFPPSDDFGHGRRFAAPFKKQTPPTIAQGSVRNCTPPVTGLATMSNSPAVVSTTGRAPQTPGREPTAQPAAG